MNVYDWDNTIYRGDSTFDFVCYCMKKQPKSLLNLPRTLWYGTLYGLRIKPKLEFKENLYHMFQYIEGIDELVETFVMSHLERVKGWYLMQQKEDDVIISASPEFLIKAFANKLNISYVMASRVDPHTGKYDGINCHGEEKVRRFYECFPEGKIDAFYSDSRSDAPLARIAKEAYLVKGNKRIAW